ncbi:SDR family NAD(P)-dependent oxidoreductase, partial [Deinococcus sp.]|uniref:SDR family NAD(P)-dependent oxidoreductase n=1 Tax=Deinococcus sp. TaxID=47478 RepID=UPI0025DBEEFF
MTSPPAQATFDFSGQRVLVTGAGKGIGRVVAVYLARSGAEIVAVSRSAADLESLHAETGCTVISADLEHDSEAVRAATEAGFIDLLVNNAGIAVLEPFLEATPAAFDRTMAVNVRAVMTISQIVARGLIERGVPGAIVNVSSQSSSVGLPDHATYCASKGAL